MDDTVKDFLMYKKFQVTADDANTFTCRHVCAGTPWDLDIRDATAAEVAECRKHPVPGPPYFVCRLRGHGFDLELFRSEDQMRLLLITFLAA